MKKRFILLIAIILMSSFVLADEVTLNDPDGTVFTDTRDVTFTCDATVLTNLININLYFGEEDFFQLNKSQDATGTTKSASFSVENIENGTYLWNCEANLENGSSIVAIANKTFMIDVDSDENNPPNFTKDIPDLKWNKSTSTTIDLAEYFSDPDGDALTYWSDTAPNIAISITAGKATMNPTEGWSGNSTIKFHSSDGEFNISSNEVQLEVIDTNGINWDDVEWNETRIVSISPIETIYTMVEGEDSVTFSITAEGEIISYKWYVNDELIVGESSSSYVMKHPGDTAKKLKVEASDGTDILSHTWTVIGRVADAPVVTEPETIVREPECGNGVREEEEDCSSCPADVQCGPGKECSNGDCLETANSNLILIGFAAGIIIFIVLAVVIFRIIRKKTKKGEEEPKLKPLSSVKKKEEPKKEESAVKAESEVKPKITPEKSEADPQLLAYIKQMKVLGNNEATIKAKLKEKGWSDEQIAPGFTKPL